MRKIFLLVWFLLWWPGYLLMWMRYLFPGSGAQSGAQIKNTRHLKRKHLFAPFYTLMLYAFGAFWFVILVGLG